MLSGRDAALLRAVADGRCELESGSMPLLYVDGQVFCDTSAGQRLLRAGLVAAPGPAEARARECARLTEAGRAELGALQKYP
jgi:hypothetical protein